MALRMEPESIHDAKDAIGWLRGQLTFGRDLGSWVPHDYPGYARILHPALEWSEVGDRVEERLVRWAEIASWSGRALAARSSMEEIAVRADGTAWNGGNRALPQETLVGRHLDRLTRYLTAATSTPDRAWFVSTDIDIISTYVAGSNDLIAGLLEDDLLEAFPADLADRFGGSPPALTARALG